MQFGFEKAFDVLLCLSDSGYAVIAEDYKIIRVADQLVVALSLISPLLPFVWSSAPLSFCPPV